MAGTPRIVVRLSSPNANKRFDACEELRVMPALPEEARLALQAAVNDPDHLVADAATRALRMHTGTPTSPTPAVPDVTPPIGPSVLALALAGLLITWASACILYFVLSIGLAPSARVDLVAILREAGRLLLLPFAADLAVQTFRLAALLFLVAPLIAVFRRGHPKRRIAVIAAGVISGTLYLFAAVVVALFSGIGQ